MYRKIVGLCRRSSASKMFVTNNIFNFKALMRKAIFESTSRLSVSNNAIFQQPNNLFVQFKDI